ncbi:hypothetical protein CgunFtcFv8_010995 [Champsocephalus gunnari]|uniref:RNA-binding protein 25 n=1 Tax=Champsocephalus gunnari TaxID=52237 RepID=A0AAN8DVD3_CHAGU|nr:hypothetical protein CgunFtcFv8_010995 [Champsocephalus gunnari]
MPLPFKVRPQLPKNGDDDEDDEDDEEVLDKDTLHRDQVVKGAIEVQTWEYASELNAPSQDPDSQPCKKEEEEDINAMEMEVDKRDLISREISKFRDTHKKPEERERSRDVSEGRSRSRERTREDKKRDREEDEEDVYERMRLERRLRDKEAAYKERLKNWEIRERKKARDYSKETEREDERRQEMMKEAKRLKEFLEDYDEDRDDPKYYRGSALQKRLLDREKETELDERDGPPTQSHFRHFSPNCIVGSKAQISRDLRLQKLSNVQLLNLLKLSVEASANQIICQYKLSPIKPLLACQGREIHLIGCWSSFRHARRQAFSKAAVWT